MKVCFITCHYPPMARTYRRYGFAKGLHDAGCEVHVITHGNISHALGAFETDGGLGAADEEFPVLRPKALPWHLAGEVFHRIGIASCPYRNWYRPAWQRAASIATAGDTILGIYPPLTNLLAAERAAVATGARLVIDFRDEYLGLSTGIRHLRARRIHRRLLEKADLVSVATATLRETLVLRDRFLTDRIHLTENGYWQETGSDSYEIGDRVQLVYVGAMSAIQGLDSLCRAVGILRDRRPDLASQLYCVLYGPDNFYRQRILQQQLVPGVEYGGFVDAPDVAAVLQQADICYLSLASERYAYAIPGKLYDYISAARPIVGSLPRGDAQSAIEENGFGLVANCESDADLAEKLGQMLSAERRRQFHQRLLAKRGDFAALPKVVALGERIKSL